MIIKNEGFEYRGYKLGAEVRYKGNNKSYKIIGLNTTKRAIEFIAIDKCHYKHSISNSFAGNIVVLRGCEDNLFELVSIDDIEVLCHDISDLKKILEDNGYTVTKNKMSIDEIITQLKEEILSNGKPFNNESKCCHNVIIKNIVLVSDAQNSLLDNHFTFSEAIKIAEKYNYLLKENGHID